MMIKHTFYIAFMCASLLTSQKNCEASSRSQFETTLDTVDTPSPNFTARKPSAIILHYTAGNTDASLGWMTTKDKPSAHYCITPDGTIHQLVKEENRAWHAGAAFWRGNKDINSQSIGIEIVGFGYDGDHVPTGVEKDELVNVSGSNKQWFPFPEPQMEVVFNLVADIQSRYNIPDHMIIGHSDVAPGRKVDPGPLFPWENLHSDRKIGAWPNFDKALQYVEIPDVTTPIWVQKHLRDYGYGVNLTGDFDKQTTMAIQAFQMHFRPENISGEADAETIRILAYLIDQYHYGAI